MPLKPEPESKNYTDAGDLILSDEDEEYVLVEGELIKRSEYTLQQQIEKLCAEHGIEAEPTLVAQILEELSEKMSDKILDDIDTEDYIVRVFGKMKDEKRIEERKKIRAKIKKRLFQLGLAAAVTLTTAVAGKTVIDSQNQPHVPTKAELDQQDADRRAQERASIESQLSEDVGQKFLAWGATPEIALELQNLLSPDGSDFQVSSEAASDIRLKAEFARNFYEYMKQNSGSFAEMRQKYVTEHPEYKYVFLGYEAQQVADILAIPGVNVDLANELVFRAYIMRGSGEKEAVAFQVIQQLMSGKHAWQENPLSSAMEDAYTTIYGPVGSENIPNINTYFGTP